MNKKYDDTDNTVIDRAITQNDVSIGCVYVLTKRVERMPDVRKVGEPHLRLIYEVELRTNAMIDNSRSIVDLMTQKEYDEWKKTHNIREDDEDNDID